jgi:hypothetical protein
MKPRHSGQVGVGILQNHSKLVTLDHNGLKCRSKFSMMPQIVDFDDLLKLAAIRKLRPNGIGRNRRWS